MCFIFIDLTTQTLLHQIIIIHLQRLNFSNKEATEIVGKFSAIGNLLLIQINSHFLFGAKKMRCFL